MQRSTKQIRQSGFTFAELAFAMAILFATSTVLINHVTMHMRSTMTERDRVFAMQKAAGILDEIKARVEQSTEESIDVDSLDNGAATLPTLSIATVDGKLIAPDHPLSDNTRDGETWQWARRVIVAPLQGTENRNVRYVTVQIYRLQHNRTQKIACEMSGIVNAPGTAFPTTQVFDLYLIAIENIPGWWVFMDTIRPFVESAITDLETRNPGLELRTHWITKSSFGRNEVYRPHVNKAVDSLQTINSVYHYPGRMPAGSASTYYYVPDNIMAHMDVDGTDTNGHDPATNPFPYALCDFYNHAMRYPDELALWEARVAAVRAREQAITDALRNGTTAPPPLDDMSTEPTYRLFLEDMYSNPNKYKNALIINLHGELLPLPALRNISDAARDPANHPEVRVVTHPEQLRYRRVPSAIGSEDPAFRVYAYNTDENNYSGDEILSDPIAVEVMNIDLTLASTSVLHPDVRLENLRGGVDVGGDTSYYPFDTAKHRSDATLLSDEMCYTAEFVNSGSERFTRILLYNTPVVAPDVGGRGLDGSERELLYGMSYVPAPCETAVNFSKDLSSSSSGTKNTARWRFVVPSEAVATGAMPATPPGFLSPGSDTTVQVRTRIWSGSDPATSGTMWPASDRNMPENLSKTYTWWVADSDSVPITERSQFQGDPRHVPYADLFKNNADFEYGYNRYFDSLNNDSENARSDFPGITSGYVNNRWRGRLNSDVPRFFEALRKGLVRSRALFTSLTGWSFYYTGIGGEIGYDSANGYPSSIPVDRTPYGGSGSGYTNTITGSRTLVRAGSGSSYWYCMPWLGELAPDSAYADWMDDSSGAPRGNLEAGTGSGRFYHRDAYGAYRNSGRTAYGTRLYNSNQRTAGEGCTSLFNINTSSSTYHHQSATGNGILTTVGQQISDNYNFTMTTTAPISRPFGVNMGGGLPQEWSQAPYNTERFTGTLFREYYTHPNGRTGSGLVKLVDPANSSAAYLVMNGIDKTVEAGSSFIGKYAVLSLVHSFFEAGVSSNSQRIEQMPRTEITFPTDVSELNTESMDIRYGISWLRWDGQPYTGSGTYSESESTLEYVLTYSRDGGNTWLFIQDDSPATPGQRPVNPLHIMADGGAGEEVYTWLVDDDAFPQGSYYLRVDCYRQGSQIHYSYHKTKLFLRR